MPEQTTDDVYKPALTIHDLDLEHLGDVLIQLGERAFDDDRNFALTDINAENDAATDDWSTVTLELTYAVTPDAPELATPVRYAPDDR